MLPRRYGDPRCAAPTLVFLADLGQRRDRGQINGAVGHIEPPVLLPSSQPHHELRVYGLCGDVVVVAMGRSSCVGVLGELLVHSRAGVLLGPVRRAVRGGGRFRWADGGGLGFCRWGRSADGLAIGKKFLGRWLLVADGRATGKLDSCRWAFFADGPAIGNNSFSDGSTLPSANLVFCRWQIPRPSATLRAIEKNSVSGSETLCFIATH